jgi:hypothetical protein
MITYAEMKAKQISFFNAFKNIPLPVKQEKPKDGPSTK